MRSTFILLLFVGCTFDSSTKGIGIDDGGVADARADAQPPPDAERLPDATTECMGSETRCLEGVLETCDDDAWTTTEQCAFACVDNARCVDASNLTDVQVSSCGPSDKVLMPVIGEVIIVDVSGVPTIACLPDGCGDGMTIPGQVISVGSAPDLALFCLSALSLPSSITMRAAELPWAIALVVDGTATIAGTINISGGDGSSGTETQGLGAGPGGPGAGAGGALSAELGFDGAGPCNGKGGEKTDADEGSNAGGGGGGGGFVAMGGGGGDATSIVDRTTFAAEGGIGGSDGCGNDALIPLVAGSGGGGGGDGSGSGGVGATTGWAGGGGGGALQISSREGIVMSGSIVARGGNGYPDLDDPKFGGGGGGGSGGSVLLEAPLLSLTGMIIVDGGDGGKGAAGVGGGGGTGATPEGVGGASGDGTQQGGGGGGGSGGRVRLNATAAPVCTPVVSPLGSCSSGSMMLQ